MDPAAITRLRVHTLADIEAFERVPLEQRALPHSTYAMIRQTALADPGQAALYYFADADTYDVSVCITYEQLLGRIHQTANLLWHLGIGPHDVISLLLPNIPQAHFLLWGGQASGIVNPVNFFLEPRQIADILRAAGTKVLAVLGPHPGFSIWEKVASIRREVPSLQAVLQVGNFSDEDGSVVNFDRAIERYPTKTLLSERRITSDESATLFHTGGTTGMPKLARHTHGNEVYNAWAQGVTMDVVPQEVRLCGLPLFHVNGAIANGLMPFSRGATVVLPTAAGYRNLAVVRNIWKIVEHYHVNMISAVPTLLSSLLQVPIDGRDISSLAIVRCGTAPVPKQLQTAFEAHTGATIIEGYGLTEATSISAVNPRYGEKRVGSIGLRLPYQLMKAVQLTSTGAYGRDCASNEVGSIVVKGPNVFPGYVDEQHNKELWIEEGWLDTGDVGFQDTDGYFWLIGRTKDLIIRGGNNIEPKMIEEALYAHPAVELAAAVGKPDAYAGELPIAYVTLKQGVTVSVEELKTYAAGMISERAAIPKDIIIMEHMPLTDVGKIVKTVLRRDAVKRVHEEALQFLRDQAMVAVAVTGNDASEILSTITITGVRAEQRPAIRERVEKALGAFTVNYRLVFPEVADR
jgi:fatty-acyl-CoA synthase